MYRVDLHLTDRVEYPWDLRSMAACYYPSVVRLGHLAWCRGVVLQGSITLRTGLDQGLHNSLNRVIPYTLLGQLDASSSARQVTLTPLTVHWCAERSMTADLNWLRSLMRTHWEQSNQPLDVVQPAFGSSAPSTAPDHNGLLGETDAVDSPMEYFRETALQLQLRRLLLSDCTSGTKEQAQGALQSAATNQLLAL
jgi:hypothetical protein